MTTPEIIVTIGAALLVIALLGFGMPLIRRRRDASPQHPHRRGPSGISDENWIGTDEPDWNWPAPDYRRRP